MHSFDAACFAIPYVLPAPSASQYHCSTVQHDRLPLATWYIQLLLREYVPDSPLSRGSTVPFPTQVFRLQEGHIACPISIPSRSPLLCDTPQFPALLQGNGTARPAGASANPHLTLQNFKQMHERATSGKRRPGLTERRGSQTCP